MLIFILIQILVIIIISNIETINIKLALEVFDLKFAKSRMKWSAMAV
ncbi:MULTISPECIES: hypothetical protein [Fusobacterium]|nr:MULTISPECIES: hypothetical protein [Fusobacterium]